ncbi:MAG: P-loop NTPase fold protein [Jiangellaceae bacterium]
MAEKVPTPSAGDARSEPAPTYEAPLVLLVGCSRFESEEISDLPSVTRELLALGDVLDPARVERLTDPPLEVTQKSIRTFLSDMGGSYPFKMLVLSSHGVPASDGLRLMMRDSHPEELEPTTLHVEAVVERAAQSPGPVLVIVESSYSGLAAQPQRSGQVAVLTSCAEREQSANVVTGLGFLEWLAKGLANGVADLSGDGRIELEELHRYVMERMADGPMPQHPLLSVSGDPSPYVFALGLGLETIPSAATEKSRSAEAAEDGRAPVATPPAPRPPDSSFELDAEGELLMWWADAVRRAAGRTRGESLDVVIGTLAGARAALNRPSEPHDPAVRTLLRSLESSERPLELILDEALRPLELPSDPASPDSAYLLLHAPVLELARSIAQQTSGAPRILQRHVLGAALTTTELSPALVVALGCDRTELCARLLDAVTDQPTGDDVQAWSAVLSPADLVSAFASDYVPVRRRRSGEPRPQDLPDHLEVDVYVTMLATMIARTSTAMPVSVGLFGEWGSGKSYFMELLRQKVDLLSSTSDPSGQYCHDIVQVTFNAWSYADTNLWASLAAEFFSQLGAPETDPDDARRAEIQKSLKEKNQVRGELESVRDAAAAQTAHVRDRYADAVATRESKTRSLNAELIKAVLADEAVHQNLGKLGKDLGIGEDQRERTLQIAEDVRGITDDLSATRRVLAQRSLRWPFYLLLVALAVTSAALLMPDGWWSWLTTSGALTSVIAFLTSVGVIVGKSRDLVGQLRAVAQAAEDVRGRVMGAGGDQNMARLTEELRRAETEEAIAQARLQELDAAIAQLDRQLIEYEPGRRLYQFIADRAASLDYRSQLGVVSLVRRDFEQLVDLMQRWRREPRSGGDGPLKPIDRIVLYIDDLDRCEPEQVVQVLQAVHLLLAMDLFVVVVGVDPRWLLRALRTRYAGILGSEAEASADTDDDLGFAQSTPQNYLEKIFQVPFVLPGMTSGGFDQLIRSLLPKPQVATGHAATVATSGPPTGPPAGEANGSMPTTAPTGTAAVKVAPAMQAERHSEVAEVIAASGSETLQTLAPISATPVTKRELDLLSTLAPLVRTPRAATRMFNIYGLLRSARDLSPGSRFLGTAEHPGDYQAVIQLLGVLTGAPHMLGLLLWGQASDDDDQRGLCRTDGRGSWKDFVESLEPTQSQPSGAWSNGVASGIPASEVKSWRLVVEQLREVRRHIQLDDVERYRIWGPQVARFSFLLSSFASPN